MKDTSGLTFVHLGFHKAFTNYQNKSVEGSRRYKVKHLLVDPGLKSTRMLPGLQMAARSSLNWSDIKGTKSKRLFRGKVKDLMNKYQQLVGGNTKVKKFDRKPGLHDNMNYMDICSKKSASPYREDPSNFKVEYSLQSKYSLFSYLIAEKTRPAVKNKLNTLEFNSSSRSRQPLGKKFLSFNTYLEVSKSYVGVLPQLTQALVSKKRRLAGDVSNSYGKDTMTNQWVNDLQNYIMRKRVKELNNLPQNVVKLNSSLYSPM